MSNLGFKLFYERHLPHFQPPGATLFITFRLAGSIPAQVQQELLHEVEQVQARLSSVSNEQDRAQQAYHEHRRLFGKWDAALDRAEEGPLWLGEPCVASLVAESLHHRDGRVYDLDAFCIMPNHVHIVFTPLESTHGTYHAISAIMHSLKRYTARQANLLRDRQGQFWQHESYDHVIRDEAERHRIIAYITGNPVKAGLVPSWEQWRWTHCKEPAQVSMWIGPPQNTGSHAAGPSATKP